MGCKQIDTDFYNFLEIVHLEKKVSVEKKCINYYPFGLKHKGYNTTVTSTNLAQNYKFGGKEFNDELGLDWYDVSARNYDPALGRWMNLDPLAEKGRRYSPYVYSFDNPIYFMDYDGMWPNPFQGTGEGIARAFRSAFKTGSMSPQQSKNINNVLNGVSNIIMGTVGAIGSGAVAIASEGIAAPLGAGTAFALSVGEISIGISQIADAFTNDSGNEAVQKSSSIPGVIANKKGLENAEMIDNLGQFVPGLLTGGNIKTVIQEGANVLAGKGTVLGAASAVDAIQDTKGVVDAAVKIKEEKPKEEIEQQQ
jgi:RHS repeat-associated protein